jgi:hypothetical protein
MANASLLRRTGHFWEIYYTSSGADFSVATKAAGFTTTGLRVKSITFFPSAEGDRLVMKNAAAVASTATAPIIMDETAGVDDADASHGNVQTIHRTFGGDRGVDMFPLIDLSDCSFGTAANVKIMLEIA